MVICPFCKKEVQYDPNSEYSPTSCEHCNRQFYFFNIHDFFRDNSHLFVIMSVFGGIAVILPAFSSSNLLGIPTNPIFVKMPLTVASSLTIFFIQFSIFMSLILMGIMMITIFGELTYEREHELIWAETRFYTIRNSDHQRYMFGIPLVILGFSLACYILLVLGDFFWIFMISIIVIFSIYFYTVFKQNPLLRKSLLDNNEPRK